MPGLRSLFRDLADLPQGLKFLALSMFVWASGDALFAYIGPLYMEQLGGTPVQIGGILGFVGAAAAIATIPAGILVDKVGMKPILWAGWLLGLVAAVFMAAASDLPWFVVGWLLYATTMFVGPAVSGYTIASRGNLPPERALTIISASYALGNVISPALGGWISSQLGLRSLFFAAAVLFAISCGLMYFVKAQPVVRPTSRQGTYRALLSDRRFVGFCGVVLAVWIAMWLGIPLGPNFLAAERGLSAAQVSTLGTFNAIGWVLLNLILGRRAPRRSFIFVQALMMVYLVLVLQTWWAGWLVVAYFARSSLHVTNSMVNAQASRLIDRAQLGLAFGILTTLNWTGNTVAALLAGRLYGISPSLPFQIGLVLLPITILLAFLFAPRAGPLPEPARAEPELKEAPSASSD